MPGFTVRGPVALPSYIGPGDIVSGAYYYWGLRAYSVATIGTNCCRIRRNPDNAEQDFVTLSTGLVDQASIVSFLAGGNGTGSFRKFYDQTGNGREIGQGTGSLQPVYNNSGLGSYASADWDGASQEMLILDFPSRVLPCTLFVTAKHATTSGASFLIILDPGSGHPAILYYREGANNNAAIFDNGAGIQATCSDNAWHTVGGVFDAGSSHLVVDGSDTAGTMSANATLGGPAVIGSGNGANYFSGSSAEHIVWMSALTPTQIANLNTNARSVWGF